MKGTKIVMTLILVFKEVASDDETKYSTLYSYSKTETVVNQSDIDDVFETIYNTIKPNIQNSLGKGLFCRSHYLYFKLQVDVII